MESNLQFVIPALMGVESTVAYELKKLGLQDVRAENGRVSQVVLPVTRASRTVRPVSVWVPSLSATKV